MKSKLIALLSCAIFCPSANAQINQRFDNSNYKAIYFKEACDLIAKTPDIVLLDVRSPGEYAENDKNISSNIGRFKGAINISIDSIDNHVKDLEAFKNKTILVYCSHSQRSRI